MHKEPNGTEISNLPNNGFKIMDIKMLMELGRRMNEHNEDFNEDI